MPGLPLVVPLAEAGEGQPVAGRERPRPQPAYPAYGGQTGVGIGPVVTLNGPGRAQWR